MYRLDQTHGKFWWPFISRSMLEYNKDVYLPRPRSGEISSRPRHHLQAKPGLSISKPIHGTPHTETDKEKHDVSLGFPLISRSSKGSANVINLHGWHESITAVHSILGLVFIEGTSQEQGTNICFFSSHRPHYSTNSSKTPVSGQRWKAKERSTAGKVLVTKRVRQLFILFGLTNHTGASSSPSQLSKK